MAQIVEFLLNNWILAGIWVVLAAILLTYMKSKAGKTVSTQEATMLINRSNGVVLDIRERKDFEVGHIVDAVNIPLAKLKDHITELEKNKENPIIVVCAMGHQSGDAVKSLEAAGFTQVSKMTGGIADWKAENLPLVK